MNRAILVLYTIFIALISLRPMNSSSIEPWDKVSHLLLYGVFAALGYRAFPELKPFSYLCVGIIAYSGLMELAQSFMPGRVMSLYDLLANVLGVIVGAFIATKLFRTH